VSSGLSTSGNSETSCFLNGLTKIVRGILAQGCCCFGTWRSLYLLHGRLLGFSYGGGSRKGFVAGIELDEGCRIRGCGLIARRVTQAKDAKSLVRLGEACIEASLGYKMFSGRYPNAWVEYEQKSSHYEGNRYCYTISWPLRHLFREKFCDEWFVWSLLLLVRCARAVAAAKASNDVVLQWSEQLEITLHVRSLQRSSRSQF
jgi:hypothetical protein